MININTKKTAYIEDYYGYGDKFFTIKNNEEIGNKLILESVEEA